MEKLNQKTLSFPAKTFAQVFAALGLMVSLTACPGKDGGGGNAPIIQPPTQLGINGCNNCSAITQPLLLTTFGSETADKAVAFKSMQMYGQATNVTANATGNNFYHYQGPIAVQGTFEVRQTRYDTNMWGQTLSACVLPAGNYTIQSTTVGSMSYYGYDVNLPLMTTTTGGIELKIEAPFSYGYGFINSGQTLQAGVTVLRVNGVTCSQDFAADFY